MPRARLPHEFKTEAEREEWQQNQVPSGPWWLDWRALLQLTGTAVLIVLFRYWRNGGHFL